MGAQRERISDTLLRHQRENAELWEWLESMTEQLRVAKKTMEEAADRLGKEVAVMASRLERERAEHDEVEDRLGRMLSRCRCAD